MATQTVADKRFPNAPAGYDIVSFAIDYLNAIGAPVTPTNIGAFVAWSNQESSGYNPAHKGGANNPLNIVATPGDGSVGAGGSQGDIADFPDPATAIAAYQKFFVGPSGSKAAVVQSFRSNAGPSAISAAVDQFYHQWGSSIDFSTAAPLDPTTGQTAASGAIGSPGVAVTSFPGSGIVSGILGGAAGDLISPFFAVFGGVKNAVLLGGQAILGLVFITIGIVIILVDTGSGKVAPIPVPV